MFTQCPACLTVYGVTPELLAQAHGSVVCSHCTAVFDALRTLSEHLPIGSLQQWPAHETQGEMPQLTQPLMRPQVQAEPTLDPFAQTEAFAPLPQFQPTPKFAHLRAIAPGLPIWLWVVGIGVLTSLLIAQLTYANRDEVLRNSFARPLLERACANLGCRLPLARDTDELVLLSRDVSPHPAVPDALIISATLRNGADHAQAFPIVEITLADLDEHRIAMRRFTPQEYLGDARTIARGLDAGASTALVFEVADPGKNAVAYEFKFL